MIVFLRTIYLLLKQIFKNLFGLSTNNGTERIENTTAAATTTTTATASINGLGVQILGAKDDHADITAEIDERENEYNILLLNLEHRILSIRSEIEGYEAQYASMEEKASASNANYESNPTEQSQEYCEMNENLLQTQRKIEETKIFLKQKEGELDAIRKELEEYLNGEIRKGMTLIHIINSKYLIHSKTSHFYLA